jgi:hypothetical protein
MSSNNDNTLCLKKTTNHLKLCVENISKQIKFLNNYIESICKHEKISRYSEYHNDTWYECGHCGKTCNSLSDFKKKDESK